jgi:hypothetical protein
MFCEILFVLLESMHFKAADRRESGKNRYKWTFFPWTLHFLKEYKLNSCSLHSSLRCTLRSTI